MAKQKTWFAQQSWNDVLFLHWPIPPEVIRPLIKKPFELDVFNGQAWITVVLFQAKDSRLRGMPSMLAYRPFLQLNLRTYVLFNNKPGIYFHSIDSNRSLVVQGARFFSIPYIKAHMEWKKTNEQITFSSVRLQTGFPQTSFSALYRPYSLPFTPSKDTINHWLIERYSFWTIKNKKVYESSLTHRPWQIQSAEVNFSFSQLFPFAHDPTFNQEPLAYYTSSMQAYLYPFAVKGLLG